MTHWYEQSRDTVVGRLNSSGEHGLSAQGVETKRAEYGENRYEKQKQQGIISKIAAQLRGVYNIVLILAALLSFL